MTVLTLSILKIIAVVMILAAMIVILLGISHLFSGNFTSDSEDSVKLKEEIKNEDTVISERNIFHEFLSIVEARHNRRNRNK